MEKLSKNGRQYIIFRLHEQYYALPTQHVIQMISVRPIMAVIPMAPPAVKGMIHVREHTIVVIDTRIKWGHQIYPDTVKTSIIVVEQEKEWLGFIVDEVKDIREVVDKEIQSVHQVQQLDSQNILKGVLHYDNKIVGVLKEDAFTIDGRLS